MKYLLIILAIRLSCVSFAQDFQESLLSYQQSAPIEKIYVSFDKPYYIPEDVIWGKVFVVDGMRHQLVMSTPIIHIDWIDPLGNTLQSYELKVKDGTASFDIVTSPDDQVGAYTIRAYSQYQLNFDRDYIFQKEILLINRPDYNKALTTDFKDYALHFFPEGGHLVNGLQSSLAFKVESADGVDMNVTGKIVDESGTFVCALSSWNDGMGKLDMTPVAGRQYWAEIDDGEDLRRFELPARLENGYVLKVHTLSDEEIHIEVLSNVDEGLHGAKLVAHVRGKVISSYNLKNKDRQLLILEKSKIPSGLVHLTLFDHKARPVAERLIFNKNPKEQVEVNIGINEEVNRNEVISGSLSIDQAKGGRGSTTTIAVYNVDILSEEIRGLDIENYLLLQSDLKGHVKDLGQYFVKDDNRTRGALDLLLMTHGWRRFDWRDVLDSTYPLIEYPREEQTLVAGRVTKRNSKKPVKADVGLNILDDQQFAALQLTTGEDGVFYFPGLDLPYETDVLLQAVVHNPKRRKKLKEGELKLVGSKNVDIEVFELSDWSYDSTKTHVNATYTPANEIEQNEVVKVKNRSKVLNPSAWTIDLDEVVIKARRYSAKEKNIEVKKRYKEKGIFFFSSTEKFLADDPQYDGFNYANIYEMIRILVPDAKMVRQGPRTTILFGRQSRNQIARIVVDGELIPIEREHLIDPKDVYAADVLPPPVAGSLYDVQIAISLLSRDSGDYHEPVPGVYNLVHPGYHNTRTFYNPVYADTSDLQNPDYRTTIYWNPDVSLRNENTSFQFRTSELTGKHLLIVEGITEDGIPFVAREYFTVVD